jgi:hypothetical protein
MHLLREHGGGGEQAESESTSLENKLKQSHGSSLDFDKNRLRNKCGWADGMVKG